MKFCLKYILILLLTTATTTILKAQTFGGNPPSIKWNQVNTPAARVIFPQGLDSIARSVATIVQQMNARIQPTIGYKQKQISIVLQNQTTVSNAYVGLAPFRSEFYLTPEQNSFDVGSLPWHEQLAIHEFRHVQQYNNFNVGLSHVLKVVFGEGGQALGNDLSIPNWFFEGDAVFNETLVSRQGRGRLPYFYNGFRALWAENKDYSYMKIRNGSYRDYTPDWYPLGFMMVAYGRQNYGDDFWKKVTHDAASYKGGFYPFQRAVKKYSGVSFDTFRKSALEHFNVSFGEMPADSTSTSAIQRKAFANHAKHFDADREFPAFINDSTLIYVKTSYDRVHHFVIKDKLGEREIATKEISIDNYFDYHDGKVVYTAYKPDARWGYRNYSELVVLDINTGAEQRLTERTKYFSPAFGDDGKTIIAVDQATSGKNNLHLIDAQSGKLLSVVPNKDQLFFTYPKFYGADKVVSAVRNNKGEMSLAFINIKTGDVKYLLPFSYQPIAFPAVKKDLIYFTMSDSVNDNLRILDPVTGVLYREAGFDHLGAIGFYQPAVSNKQLAWVTFTAEGYKVVQEEIPKLETVSFCCGLQDFGIFPFRNDSAAGLLPKIKTDELPITKYPKFYHPFNFHSLIPNFSDPNYQLSLSGENVLNTLQTDVSFTYNRDEGYKDFGFEAVYGALFPYLTAGADYTIDRKGFYKGSDIYWNETQVHAGLQLPLDLSGGKHYTNLQFGSSLVYSQTHFQQPYQNLFNDRQYVYSSNFISFSNSTQQARKNIYPDFAQSISLKYRSAITSLSAKQFTATGALYFPGLFVNQSLVLGAAFQQKDKNNVISFSNDFPFSRGYEAENLHKMDKLNVNYHFPIAYPDWGFANTVYFMRVRGNVFYDYTHATDFFTNGTQFKGDFRSTGGEIYFDTKFFNQNAITFGFRYSRLLNDDIFGGTGRNRFELIVPVTIF